MDTEVILLEKKILLWLAIFPNGTTDFSLNSTWYVVGTTSGKPEKQGNSHNYEVYGSVELVQNRGYTEEALILLVHKRNCLAPRRAFFHYEDKKNCDLIIITITWGYVKNERADAGTGRANPSRETKFSCANGDME